LSAYVSARSTPFGDQERPIERRSSRFFGPSHEESKSRPVTPAEPVQTVRVHNGEARLDLVALHAKDASLQPRRTRDTSAVNPKLVRGACEVLGFSAACSAAWFANVQIRSSVERTTER